jgi:hypothetical protein
LAIAALAGRRIDAAEASPARFPASEIRRVSSEIERALVEEKVQLLVCSAASGADLLALEAARKLRIRSRVVLPFAVSRFRATSVTDRSEDWGELFDQIIAPIKAAGDLVVVDDRLNDSDDDAYAQTTRVILNEAKRAASPDAAIAILIWDGKSRGENDFADQFRRLADIAGMKRRVILTHDL